MKFKFKNNFKTIFESFSVSNLFQHSIANKFVNQKPQSWFSFDLKKCKSVMCASLFGVIPSHPSMFVGKRRSDRLERIQDELKSLSTLDAVAFVSERERERERERVSVSLCAHSELW